MRRWKRKFFVLDGSLLRYYHDEKDIRDGVAPNGIVTLANCTIHEGGVSDTWGSLRIHLSDGAVGRVYCFSGPKPDEIIKWYKEIEAVLNMHQGGILSKTTSSKSSSSANSSSVSSSSANNASANNASGTASSSNDTSSANASSSANMPYYTGNPDFVADEFSGGEGDDEDAAYDDGRFSHDSRDLTSTMAGTVSGADEEDVGHRFMHGAAQTQRVGTLLHARAMAHGHLGSKTRKKNNRLRRGLKKGLAKSVKSLVSLYREADAWQLLGVENGIRVCLLKPSVAYEMGLAFPTPLDISKAADREVTAKNIAKREKTGKGLSKYGLQPVLRGVCVIKAPPSAVSRLIMDVRERKHWDPHFSVAEEVDSCFPRTQLVRLRGRLAWRRNSASALDRVCRAVSATGVRGNLGKKCGAGCCNAMQAVGSVVGSAAVAGAMSAGAAALAHASGHDGTVAAISGAALAGAAFWHSGTNGQGVSAAGSRGAHYLSSHGGACGVGASVGTETGTYRVGPVSINVEQQASNRTVFCVQHLCTMGRDSDVIVERSVVSNNPKYKQDTSTSSFSKKAGKSQAAAPFPLKSCVEATVGLSGWIVEPLVVRERVVSQVSVEAICRFI